MVPAVLRSFIENSLETMEQGSFQDFCLDFLPLYNDIYAGLIRFGHTPAGKTRPGTPDLLKTYPDGSQIAVQCGTEDGYWSIPKTNKKIINWDRWKPYVDIVKCLSSLNNIKEIVVISNRDIPTNSPNTKHLLLDKFKDRKDFIITAISREDIGQNIHSNISNPKYRRLLAQYIPELSEHISSTIEAEKYRLSNEIITKSSFDITAKTFLKIFEETFAYTDDRDVATKQILDEITSVASYRLPSIPQFTGFNRPSVASLELSKPLGKVWGFVGIPKIGKTMALMQLANSWNSYKIIWYDCPIGNDECGIQIEYDILRSLFPNIPTEMLNTSYIYLSSNIDNATIPDTPVVFIVDNLNHLSSTAIKRISNVITNIKSILIKGNIAIIFTSNKIIPQLNYMSNNIIAAPPWPSEELGVLLDNNNIIFDNEKRDKYLEMLQAFSGGHPLLAKALARKYPNEGELLINGLSKERRLCDESFSREVQQFLYDDILTDADTQNLIQRLSLLIWNAPTDIIESLRIDIKPNISKSFNVIYDSVGGIVIEGNATIGYCVQYIFKQIAQEKVSFEERNNIYLCVSNKLLSIKNKTLEADRITAGIQYSILSGDIKKACSFTALLFHTALKKGIDSKQLEILLSRLFIVSATNPGDSFEEQFTHSTALVLLAQAYAHLEKYDEAAKMLANVKLNIEPPPDHDMATAMPLARVLTKAYRSLLLAYNKDNDPIKEFCEINIDDVIKLPNEIMLSLFDVLDGLSLGYSVSNINSKFFRKLIIVSNETSIGYKHIVTIARRLGYYSKDNSDGIDFISTYFPDNPLGNYGKCIAIGTMFSEKRESEKAIEYLDKAILFAGSISNIGRDILGDAYLVKGDTYYNDKQNTLAEEEYTRGSSYFYEHSFEYGWIQWRLGILKNDRVFLEKAESVLKASGCNKLSIKVLGGIISLLLEEKRYIDVIEKINYLTDLYYFKKDESAGPTLSLVLMHVGQNTIPETYKEGDTDLINKNIVINPRMHSTLSDDITPKYGPIGAYYMICKLCILSKNNVILQSNLKNIIHGTIETPADKNIKIIAIKDAIEFILNNPYEESFLIDVINYSFNISSQCTDININVSSMLIFNGIDTRIKNISDIDKIVNILQIAEKETDKGGISNSFYWKSEISIRMARLSHIINANISEQARKYRKALILAKIIGNGEYIVECGTVLGFSLVSTATSLRELGELQYETMKGIEIAGNNPSTLEAFGNNLFSCWNNLKYSKISEHDLKTIKYLRNQAIALSNMNVPKEISGASMVLLLGKLHGENKIAREWGVNIIKDKLLTLPEDIQILINEK